MVGGGNERLLILGSSVRAAARSAFWEGFAVHAADQFGDRDLRETWPEARLVKYPEGLLEYATTVEPCAWLYTGGLENYPEVVEKISERHELLGNGAEVLRRVRDPKELAAFAAAHGYRFPETRISRPTDNRTWLIKRIASSGGLGVRLANSESKLAKGECFQECIDGVPGSAAFLASKEKTHFLFASEQLVDVPCLGAPKFHYAGNLKPASPEGIDFPLLGRELAAEFGLLGLFGVDYVLREGQLWLLEINPRYTASMESWERGMEHSLIYEHVLACRGESAVYVEPTPSMAWPTIKAILYARADGQITDSMSDWLMNRRLIADVPMGGSAVAKGKPVLTIVVHGRSRDEVMRYLEERVKELRALGIP